MRLSSRFLSCLLPALLASSAGQAAYVQVSLPLDSLPAAHDYQKALRLFLRTLGTNDLAVPVLPFSASPPADDDARYKLWLLAQQRPGISEIRLPPEAFTLAAIEGTNGLALPAEPGACQSLAWLATWDHPGNPYLHSRPVKLRALVLAAIDLCMLDALHEQNPQGSDRADFFGGNLIWIGDTFLRCKDALPPEARLAFENGLRKAARRIAQWGPKGMMTDMDLFAPVGLWYIQQALGDPEIRALAETFSRPLFTDPAYFNEAGYFVDNGCFDTSYNGISLYFGSWAALASDWPFADAALDKAYRLRAYLCFPNPGDKGASGPSAMSSRTSGDPARDQWQFPARLHAAAMLSDDALCAAVIPDSNALASAAGELAAAFNSATNAKYTPRPWVESHWSRRMNFAADLAPTGHYARLVARRAAGDPLLLSPYRRPGDTFTEAFGEAFVIGRYPSYAFAVHTGPVGRSFGHNNLPYGFGGGQLSIFWTPAAGVALAGRRRGVQGSVTDSWDEWRSWPVHAVSGLAGSNRLVTSNRLRQPAVTRQLAATGSVITVSGRLPALDPAARTEADSGFDYRRRFETGPGGISVETSVSGTNFAAFTELVETLPFFLQEVPAQPAARLSVKAGGEWRDAAAGLSVSNAAAIRANRFDGAVEVTFDRPRAVRFAPVWRDGYQSKAEACTVLVDLLDPPTATDAPRVIRYTIQPITPK